VTGRQAHPAVPSAPDDVWRGTFTPPAVPRVRPPRPPRDRIWFRQAMLRLMREPLSRDARRQRAYAILGLLLAISLLCLHRGHRHRHRRLRHVTQFRWHAGRPAAADGVHAGCPEARRAPPRAWQAGCWECGSRRRPRCAGSLAPWAGPVRSWPIRSAGGPVPTCCSSCPLSALAATIAAYLLLLRAALPGLSDLVGDPAGPVDAVARTGAAALQAAVNVGGIAGRRLELQTSGHRTHLLPFPQRPGKGRAFRRRCFSMMHPASPRRH